MTLLTSQYPNLQAALTDAINQRRDLKIDAETHVTGPFSSDIPENFHAWGGGNDAKVLIDFPGGDALVLGAAGEERNTLLEDFSILPATNAHRTSGFALRLPNMARGSINNVDIGTAEHPTLHYGGLCIDKLDDSSIDDGNIYARKTCFELGSGADLTIGGGVKMQNHRQPNFSDALPSAVGVHLRGGFGGLYVGATHTIYCGLGWLIEGPNRELFFNPGTVVDSCLDDGIRAMPNSFGTLALTGAWVASNGRQVDGDGLGVEAGQQGIVQINGGRFFNHKRGSGVVLNGATCFVDGPVLDSNRDYGLWVPNAGTTGASDPLFGRANGKGLVRNDSPNFKVGRTYG